jgi:hypothetical protein
MDEFWEIVGSETDRPRLCGRSSFTENCPVIVSGNQEDWAEFRCQNCKRNYVICTCGDGLAVHNGADDLRICVNRKFTPGYCASHTCPRLDSNTDQENQ